MEPIEAGSGVVGRPADSKKESEKELLINGLLDRAIYQRRW